jgi:hypothetical protein
MFNFIRFRIWSVQSSRLNCLQGCREVLSGDGLYPRTSEIQKNQVPPGADGYMPFPSLIGKFERPDHIIMAFEPLTWPFFADFRRSAQSSGPKLKLMTARKCQNSRHLAVPGIGNFHII